ASVVFQHFHYTFIADSTTTTVQFTDVGLNNQTADTLIDSVSVAPNLLSNPNFDVGIFNTPGNVASWVVAGNGHVAQLDEGATSPSHGAAFSAGTNSQGDSLAQTVSTDAGQLYAVEFDAGVFGNPAEL